MLEVSFNPFPELITERLLLRPVIADDTQAVFELRSDPDHMRYIAKPLMQTLADAEAHIRLIQEGIEKNEMINWGVSLKENPELIGIIGFYRINKAHHRSEVGYMLNKKHWRKGIMHEALMAVVKHGFEKMDFHQLEAIIDKENVASEKLLLKNNFSKEAHFKENYFFEGKYLDSVHYCRLNEIK